MPTQAAGEIWFQEEQRFRQPWLWVALLLPSALLLGTTLWIMTRPMPQNAPMHAPPLLYGAGAAVVLLNCLALLLVAVSRLQTEVSSAGLFVRFFPYHRKVRQLSLEEVTGMQIVKYRPFADYGGHGIRRRHRAMAYTVHGRRGIRLDYNTGAHVLLGSQQPEALSAALEKLNLKLSPTAEESDG